jgi:ABC-2 type transport system ATP-binding protein
VLNGVDIYSAEPSRESLEEFYMELTGDGAEQGTEKG